MYQLDSDYLFVNILDPIEDSCKLGTRYCTGGSIFSVFDKKGNSLLSGPTYPSAYNTFDGQGIPDSFNHIPLCSSSSDNKLILGIGICSLEKNIIIEPCKWVINRDAFTINFHTQHNFGSYNMYLQRSVAVDNNKIISLTQIRNIGNKYIPLTWYPHPFFHYPKENIYFEFESDFDFDNDKLFYEKEGRILRKKIASTSNTTFQPIILSEKKELEVKVFNNFSMAYRVKTDYYSSSMPIWCNEKTISIEPYLETTIFPDAIKSWKVIYEFII